MADSVSRLCSKCGGNHVILDFESGLNICCSCGTIQGRDDNNFISHVESYVPGQAWGASFRLESSESNYKQRKEYEARKTIEEITGKLQLSTGESEVKYMVDKITKHELGAGLWFPVLVGACACVVARQNQLPLTLAEVAGLVGCNIHVLGDMFNRVQEFLELNMPELNITMLLERAIQNSASFRDLGKEKLDTFIWQGRLLLKCSIQWSLTTGRRPVPVIAAIMTFVANINGVAVDLSNICNDLSACEATSTRRLRELQESLIKVAKTLPWGGDITRKNLQTHAPFIVQYLQLNPVPSQGASRHPLAPNKSKKSFEKYSSKAQHGSSDVQSAIHGSLSMLARTLSCKYDSGKTIPFQEANNENELHASKLSSSPGLVQLKLPKDSPQEAYVSFRGKKRKLENQQPQGQTRISLQEYVSQRSESLACEFSNAQLPMQNILEKSGCWDSPPPAFSKSSADSRRRRSKIQEAKLRIKEIKENAPIGRCYTSSADKKRKLIAAAATCKSDTNVDWEDCIIELLLLHQVDEKEIETGHYRALLDLHVFSGQGISDDEIKSCLRTKEEMALLSLLSGSN